MRKCLLKVADDYLQYVHGLLEGGIHIMGELWVAKKLRKCS